MKYIIIPQILYISYMLSEILRNRRIQSQTKLMLRKISNYCRYCIFVKNDYDMTYFEILNTDTLFRLRLPHRKYWHIETFITDKDKLKVINSMTAVEIQQEIASRFKKIIRMNKDPSGLLPS